MLKISMYEYIVILLYMYVLLFLLFIELLVIDYLLVYFCLWENNLLIFFYMFYD